MATSINKNKKIVNAIEEDLEQLSSYDGEVAKSYRRKMDADDFATRSNNDIRVLRDVSTHKSKGKIKRGVWFI